MEKENIECEVSLPKCGTERGKLCGTEKRVLYRGIFKGCISTSQILVWFKADIQSMEKNVKVVYFFIGIFKCPSRQLILFYDTGKRKMYTGFICDYIRIYGNETDQIQKIIEEISGRFEVRIQENSGKCLGISIDTGGGVVKCTKDHLSYDFSHNLEWKIVGNPRRHFRLEPN